MELFIDGRRVDIDALTDAHITLTVASVTDPEYGRAGYTKSISIPMTSANRELMSYCEQINAANRFNSEIHSVRLESDGCVVMEGVLMLAECRIEDGDGRYVFNIIGSAKKWVDYAANTTFSSLFPEFYATLEADMIRKSWTDAVAVRWLPVVRNKYVSKTSSSNSQLPEMALTVSDYHPFIHCRTLMHRIFSDAGYSISSDFIDSDYFDTFYMSGRYTTHDVEMRRKSMDFRAARFEEATAYANSYGEVFANPGLSGNTLGNIVDTADPNEVRNGKTIAGVYDNGGCFVKKDNRISFVPKYEIKVGFEYKLRYRTAYRIKSRTQLCGFDRISLGDEQIVQLRIPNRFVDRRNQFKPMQKFRCIICNYIAGYTYRLVANRVTSYSEQYTIAQFSSSSAIVNTSDAGNYVNLRVLCAMPGNPNFNTYSGEWLLYDEAVAETGETEVDILVRDKVARVTPYAPKTFSNIFFAGAENGMKLRLLSAEVRPVFHIQPSVGETVSFYDIGVHNISCLSVIKSFGEMFGLCYYTDDLEKKVYIEPRDMFYCNDVVVDWSDRIDLSKPIGVGEISAEMPGRITWKYRGGDAATAEYNTENGGHFGMLTVEIGNPLREMDEKIYENRFFTTTINNTGIITSAPSASLPCAAEPDRNIDDLNFTPKIVRYMGMKRLPAGEIWGWPSFESTYPLSAFHYPYPVLGVIRPQSASGESLDAVIEDLATGFTLCNENREGVKGMRRWWEETLNTYHAGIRLSVWLSLTPDDIESFVMPNYLKRDFRAHYRLHIDGEWGDWKLEEICDYTPDAPSTRCIFTKNV